MVSFTHYVRLSAIDNPRQCRCNFKPVINSIATICLAVAVLASIIYHPSYATTIFINELHYDNSGIDVNEGIEIAGPANTSLQGWTVALYNASNGAVYKMLPLAATLSDQCGQFGLATIPIAGIQNGSPDGLALINTRGKVVQFISYEGQFTALDGPAAGLLSDDIGVTESSKTAPGLSLQLAGSGSQLADFAWVGPKASTFSTCSALQSFSLLASPLPISSLCRVSPTLISSIQGTGSTASDEMLNSVRTVKAVLTADFQKSGLKGFFLQEEDADNDNNSLTSEGIFVYQGNHSQPLTLGSIIAVTARVVEFKGSTQLSNVTAIEQCAASGSTTVATISLPFQGAAHGVHFLERFAGMQVQLKQPLTIIDTYHYGRYGQITLANGRLMQPTNIALPGTAASNIATLNALNQIVFDDNESTQNRYPINNPDGSAARTAQQVLRAGNQLDNNGQAILHFRAGKYVLQPISPFSMIASNPRSTQPALLDTGNLRVASFNLLNYFTTLDQGKSVKICGPSFNQSCRGADSAVELDRQRGKIVAALLAIDADIIGLMELENNPSASVQNLVDALNNQRKPGQYRAVETGIIGDDSIKVGFIYQAHKVRTIGAFKLLNQHIDSRFVDAKNRPALLQTFAEIASGEHLTVVVNHLKSKGSNCDALDDPDLGDGQGNCNKIRTQAMAALVDYLARDPTDSDDPDILIIGDLNAYAKEDPISLLKTAGFTDLIATLGGDSGYSYIFQGRAGYLDHALANVSLAPQVTDLSIWHINADEPRIIDYNTEFKSHSQVIQMYRKDAYRSSDHDPVIIQFRLSPIAPN